MKNLAAIRKYLKNKTVVQELNSHLKDGRKAPPQNLPEAGSIREIYSWLNKNGEVMSLGKISK